MKSIDEVTKALSMCGRHPDCIGCPYENVSYPTEIGNTCKDIMHYDALYYMQDRIDKCQEANSPLTWDELKQMEGKPIWIALQGNDHWKGWDVIAGFDEDDFGVAMVTVHNDDYYKLDLGKTWQAYRNERKATGGNLIPEPKSKKIGDYTEIKWKEKNVSRNND